MNLQENIERIQSMMGVIVETSNDKFTKMVDEFGFSRTIELIGGGKVFLNLFKDYNVSEKDKIDYIRNKVKEISEKYYDNDGSFWLTDLDMDPIVVHQNKENKAVIELLDVNYVLIYLYGGKDYGEYSLDVKEDYRFLHENVLDEIFYQLLNFRNDE
jgi:hypothetical protein